MTIKNLIIKMKIKKITYLFTLIILFSTKYKAQTVFAQVSSKQVQVGVPFEYAIFFILFW